MTGRRNTIIAVCAIVLFAAIVGFFITLDVSPQIAYARLFIDVGLVIGLVAVILAFYKETPLSTATLIHAMRELSLAKYQTRVSVNEGEPLSDIALAINDLAKVLEAAHNRQEEIKQGLREELLPRLKEKKIGTPEHSFHPEIGPVLAIPENETAKQAPSLPNIGPFYDLSANRASLGDQLNNTLVESQPPSEQKLESGANKLDYQDQDLGELYQNFIRAQEEINITKIEYGNFLKSVEKTRHGIMQNHQCKGVYFDVVKQDDQVALQPRLIREHRA